MEQIKCLLTFAGMITAFTCFAGANNQAVLGDDPDGRVMMQQAQRIIAAYHKGQPRSTNVLRVVYFIPKDGDALPNFEARLDRVVTDVNDFYRDGLRRFGIKTDGLPLERKDGKLVVHVVHGKLTADKYHADPDLNYGAVTAQEIRLALNGTIDMDREQVLVFYSLCRKDADGTYVFDAPYYGDASSSQKRGLCHAADCELLDPILLTDTNRTMVFTERNYTHLKLTMAQFNSLYIGGVAHELGHALGLPHDDGGMPEKSFGISLMGEGNLTYRQEVWGGGMPTYLGRASALQLASHPLFTGSNRGRWNALESGFKSLMFSAKDGTLKIQGVVTSSIPAYAVIAYAWEKDDHFAITFPCVLKNGAFTIDVDCLKTNKSNHWHLNLATLFANGAVNAKEFPVSFNALGVPDVAALNTEWIVGPAEIAVMTRKPDARKFVTDKAIAEAPTSEAARKLRLLREVLDPPAPLNLADVRENRVFLSDAVWTDAKVGWGQVARNHYWFDETIQNGVFLSLGGQFFDKGLYAHSNARFVFPVDGKWKTFSAAIGIRDGANIQGSAIFTVRGDGRELYRSRILRVGERADVKVDISKVKELELLTEGGEGHNHNSWAIWAETKVLR